MLDETGVDAGIVVFLQATSPFIDPRDIDVAVELVRANEYDCVFSATETYGFLWAAPAGAASGVNHDPSTRPRRQDREPHYLETGAFYVMDAAGFRTARHRFFGRIGLVEVAERTAIEIDSEEQLALAQAIAPLMTVDADPIDVAAVVTDFDGVHTDDTVITDADGRESVRVSRSDGMGVARLRRAGIPVLILSTETNPVVSARARKLQVDVRQGVDDKATALLEWVTAQGIPLSRVAYIGNDINDLGCLEVVGLPVAVPEAHPLVLAAARVIVSRMGGRGAVRELADRVLREPPAATITDARIAQRRTRIMTVTIGSRVIGGGRPAYVIAEIGLNHNGDVELAKQLIDVAAEAGADAVKFQKRTPEISTPAAHARHAARDAVGHDDLPRLPLPRRVHPRPVHRGRRPRAAAGSGLVRVAVGRAERAVPRRPERRRTQDRVGVP